MSRYKFIVGVTLAALEEELNRIVAKDPRTKLIQVFYAQGAGYVAVVEYLDNGKAFPNDLTAGAGAPKKLQQKLHKKS